MKGWWLRIWWSHMYLWITGIARKDKDGQLTWSLQKYKDVRRYERKGGSPVHKAPTYAGYGKGSHHLVYCTQSYPVFYTRGFFQDLNLWPFGTERGQPGAQSSHIRRVRKGVPPFGVLYAVLPCFLHKRLFPRLEPVTFRSHDNNFTVAPRLPLEDTKKTEYIF